MAKKKQVESIWTRDIAPDIVRILNADITPDFSSEFWNQDITHHVIGTMAVFGLVVSSLITTLGVAAVGVNVELAIAQQAATTQTAALALAEVTPRVAPLPQNTMVDSSSTMPRPPKMDDRMGSSTDNRGMGGMMGSTTQNMATGFCPKLSRTVMRGSHDATTTGDVGQLQQFMAEHFKMDKKDVVSGFFGSTTQALVQKFQQEQGIATSTTAGPLTRAAIARLCNPSSHDQTTTNGDTKRDDKGMHPGMMGSSTGAVGNMPPLPPLPSRDGMHTDTKSSSSTQSGVTVQVVSPNGGENYHAGSGDTLTVSWVATGVPSGAQACVSFLSANNKRFMFPHVQHPCVAVSNGTGSVSGTLDLTKEYVLTAGSYVAQVTIVPSNGTEGGVLAQDSSDGKFTLDDEDLGVNTLTQSNASNAASIIEAVNEIGDGYGRLFTAGLKVLGL